MCLVIAACAYLKVMNYRESFWLKWIFKYGEMLMKTIENGDTFPCINIYDVLSSNILPL